MDIFVIQEELDGIVEEPRLFRDEKEADECYISMVNENFEQNFDDIKKAVKYMSDEERQFDGYMVRYWTLKV